MIPQTTTAIRLLGNCCRRGVGVGGVVVPAATTTAAVIPGWWSASSDSCHRNNGIGSGGCNGSSDGHYASARWMTTTGGGVGGGGGPFHRSVPVYEQINVKVPTMGDSITEGTIVEWTVHVGQAVNEGDVVALIETDKVTVDIKADQAGVIQKHFGAVDDTVEVGADLYQLDTDAVATVEASSEGAEAADSTTTEEVVASTPAAAAPAVTTSSSSTTSGLRVPSIQFLGKDGWARRRQGLPPTTTDDMQDMEDIVVTLIPDDPNWDPMYGRPSFTEEEMEALEMGGASVSPSLLKPSRGAIFG